MTGVMPFGKFKGESLEVVRADVNYRRWLLQQTWLPERFPEVHAFLADEKPRPKTKRGGTHTAFRFERVSNAKLGFVARPRCLVCGSEFDVPLGSVQAAFLIGRELVGVACGRCAVPRQSVEQ